MEFVVKKESKQMRNFQNGSFVKNGSYICIVTKNNNNPNGWIELWNIEKNVINRVLPWWYGQEVIVWDR